MDHWCPCQTPQCHAWAHVDILLLPSGGLWFGILLLGLWFELIFMKDRTSGFGVIFCPLCGCPTAHILKRSPFSYCFVFAPLTKVSRPYIYIWGSVLGIPILVHWCIYLLLSVSQKWIIWAADNQSYQKSRPICQNHSVLDTLVLQYISKLDSLSPSFFYALHIHQGFYIAEVIDM